MEWCVFILFVGLGLKACWTSSEKHVRQWSLEHWNSKLTEVLNLMSWCQEIAQTNVHDVTLWVTLSVTLYVSMAIDTYIRISESIYLEKGDRFDGIYTKRVEIASRESIVAFN